MIPKELQRIEQRLIRQRNRLERKGIKMAYSMLKSLVPETVTSIENIEKQIDTISKEPVQNFFEKYYGMVGADFGMFEYKRFVNQKAEDDYLRSTFYEEMVFYCRRYCGDNIQGIIETTKRLLKTAAKQAVSEANVKGWGIDKTKDYILELMGNTVKPARARAIAQTEVITASNRASYEAANKTGLTFKKYWSTSGLPGIRASHLLAESYSVQRQGIAMNDTFDMGDGTKMLHPGDPAGGAGNVINCRCTVIQIPV